MSRDIANLAGRLRPAEPTNTDVAGIGLMAEATPKIRIVSSPCALIAMIPASTFDTIALTNSLSNYVSLGKEIGTKRKYRNPEIEKCSYKEIYERRFER